MIYRVFAIFDGKAEYYMTPFMVPTVAHAVRGIMDECARPDSIIARHPSDFALYQVAEWDDQTGRYTSLPQYAHIGPILSFMPKRQPELSFSEISA